MPRLTVACLGFLLAAWLGVAGVLRAEDRVGLAELSPETESAIVQGLKYLSENQNSDGSFGREHVVAETALTLMAFMVQGNFPERPPYGEQMRKGVDHLLEAARRGKGYMGHSMYEHGLATLALSEAWGMSSRKDEIRETLRAAVQLILFAQNKEGGWRYQPRPQDADVSVTVMQLMALASAQEAGILVPDETIKKAIEYVKACSCAGSGGFAYQAHKGGPALARSAAGVMSLLITGERKCPEVEQGLRYLLGRLNTRDFDNADHYLYAQYYCIQVMYQAGDSYYQQWYPKIRDALLKKQTANGSFNAPGRDAGSPVRSTAFAILILGVPYRFLPIYQR